MDTLNDSGKSNGERRKPASQVDGDSSARQLVLLTYELSTSGNVWPLRTLTNESSLRNLEVKCFAEANAESGSYNDVPSITSSMKGVSSVFLNTWPDFSTPDGEIQYARNFVTAAKAVGTVDTFVVSTAHRASEKAEFANANNNDYLLLAVHYSNKAGVERVIKEAGFKNMIVLRPGWLNYNYVGFPCQIHFPRLEGQHILDTSYGKNHKIEHFDPNDVSKIAMKALLEPEIYAGRIIELVGEMLTFEDVTRIIEKVSGVQIKVVHRTLEQTQEIVEKGTMPVIQAQLFEAGLAGIVGEEWHHDGRDIAIELGDELDILEAFLARERQKLLHMLGADEKWIEPSVDMIRG
ncbi:hypothetical protein CJF32_00001540 [Rutstroemia sp. NJR-2017a WRK4]|nr:hypothetical protein CJF32_00001540 [Rutstroemia sp. NJR-2017a WRK4]